jgi:hypothetical protein
MKKENAVIVGGGCGAIVMLLIINITVGALCFQYALWSIFAKDIPWYGDVMVGLVGGQFAVPVAFVCWIIRLCGVEVPFYHQ